MSCKDRQILTWLGKFLHKLFGIRNVKVVYYVAIIYLTYCQWYLTLHWLSLIANRFYRLLPIDLHESSHYYHFEVLNALSSFTILPCTVAWSVLYVLPHCFMYWVLYMPCQKWRNKDVQSIIIANHFLTLQELASVHIYGTRSSS